MKIVKLFAVGLLLALSFLAGAHAQEEITYRTNVLINVALNLTVYEQVYTENFAPNTKTSKVETNGIIAAIAHQAHITNDLSNAKLYYRLSWSGTNDSSRDMILRNIGGQIMGTNDMVVNNYFSLSFPDTVTTERANADGTMYATDHTHLNATLSTSQGSFNLHGIALIKSGGLFDGRKVIERSAVPKTFTATVTGSGSVGFHRAEWQGTITGSGQKIEITPVSQ
jgi:hypothetical protein